MDQVNLTLECMEQKYRLELRCMELQAQIEALSERIPQALFAKRVADEKLRGYENGGLRGLFHKMSGNYASQLEEYRTQARFASNILEQKKQEQQSLERSLTQLQREITALSDADAQCAAILQTDLPELQWAKKKCAALSASFHGKEALFFLEGNKAALLMARDSTKTVPVDRLQIAYDRDQALEQADQCAHAYRERVQLCNNFLSMLGREILRIGEYFESPTSYIVGAASQWAWMDRINLALDQILTSKNDLQRVIALLEES